MLAQTAAADVQVNDDSGAVIRLAAPAKRIVSLAPHVTEVLFAAGAGDKLVGAVEYSNYPAAAKKIPRVGSYARLDLEAIAALKPDLLVAWESGNAPAELTKLRALGLTVYVTQPNRIEDIPRDIERYGRLAGTEGVANAEAGRFRARYGELGRQYSQRPAVSVFYEIWKQPLMTVNGKQIISDVLRLCGGRNVFADLPLLAPTVSVESVIAADPEAIVASGMDESRPEWLDDWRRWGAMTAVKRDNLYFVPPDLIQRHTPRILEGATQLCAQLENARGKRRK
ncbi:MAG: cobalamin-binding protein [Rhodocyclaceae bacterium]|nr:MAG: cobalamin-binding protein [Rhodocyclaceae bacterium]